MKANQTAMDLYLSRMEAIKAKLVQLQNMADEHFGVDPDNIHWGHVGDLGRIDDALKEIIAL